MAESFLQQQLKLFSDNQSGPKFTLIYGNRLKGYIFSILTIFIFGLTLLSSDNFHPA